MKLETEVMEALKLYQQAFYGNASRSTMDDIRMTTVIAVLYWVLERRIQYATGAFPDDATLEENPVHQDLTAFRK